MELFKIKTIDEIPKIPNDIPKKIEYFNKEFAEVSTIMAIGCNKLKTSNGDRATVILFYSNYNIPMPIIAHIINSYLSSIIDIKRWKYSNHGDKNTIYMYLYLNDITNSVLINKIQRKIELIETTIKLLKRDLHTHNKNLRKLNDLLK